MKKYVLLFVGGALSLTACVKHVIIPTPEPPPVLVEFDCQFDGNINGTTKSLASGVNGFECSHLNTIVTVTDNDTKGVWYNEIHHPSSSEAIRLTHGEIAWPAADALPTLDDWSAFYTSNVTPVIADAGEAGVELSYTDNAGTVFKTRDTSNYANSIVYTFVEAESADNGSFVKFTATIDVKLYSEGGTLKTINAATLKGAYKFQ
jgi:hypothetical protein